MSDDQVRGARRTMRATGATAGRVPTPPSSTNRTASHSDDPLRALVWLVTAMALTGDTRPAEELSRRVGELASAAIADVTHLVGSAVADLFGRPTGEAPTEPAASAPIQAASSVVVDRPARLPAPGRSEA